MGTVGRCRLLKVLRVVTKASPKTRGFKKVMEQSFQPPPGAPNKYQTMYQLSVMFVMPGP